MVPFPDVVSLRADASLSEIKRTVLEAGHTRYPVVSDDDQVVGFVDLKDVLRAGETDAGEDTTAGDPAREIAIVPETTSIGGLVLDRIGRAPEAGDSVDIGEYTLEVTSVDGTRIEAIDISTAAPSNGGDMASGHGPDRSDDEPGE